MTPQKGRCNLKRNRAMLLRFTDGELEALTAKAHKAGLSRESYCRQILSGAEVREAPSADVPALIRESRRAGSNIHQILRTANAIGLVDVPRLREAIDELHSVNRLITDAYTTRAP